MIANELKAIPYPLHINSLSQLTPTLFFIVSAQPNRTHQLVRTHIWFDPRLHYCYIWKAQM